jgi:GTP-binding protein HflX
MEEREKALLVGVNLNSNIYFRQSMEELENLTLACNIDVVGKIEQNLNLVNKSIYIGTGKVEEVKELANDLNVDIIIFNNELTHSQLRNLQKILDIPILDRTSLILQIFSSRAKTKEAKLQVEVASLEYMLPRLVGLHNSLGRQGGGSGLSNKGSGEKKLELDRRRIEDKLTELKKELEELSLNRENQRRKRKKSGYPMVALAGYTNAGKSTLMNAMLETYRIEEYDKKVFEKDMLFATLETTVRQIELENKKTFLLSDTVGFISELPHNLIKAFRSTLEEIKDADLIIHVVDYSDPNHERHIEVTKSTLEEIGAKDIPVIYVYNKSDLELENLPIFEENKIYMSAKTKVGLKELIEMISKRIYSDYLDCNMLIPYDKGNIISYLNQNATIFNTEYTEEGTIVFLNCKDTDYNKYKEYVIE